MGCLQAVQPRLGKEGVGPPLLLICSVTTDPFQLPALPQQAPQSAAYPAVQAAEDREVAALEVPEPAHKRPVQIADDPLQAPAVGPLRLRPDGVLQLLQALGPNVTPVTVEPVTQEVESL